MGNKSKVKENDVIVTQICIHYNLIYICIYYESFKIIFELMLCIKKTVSSRYMKEKKSYQALVFGLCQFSNEFTGIFM